GPASSLGKGRRKKKSPILRRGRCQRPAVRHSGGSEEFSGETVYAARLRRAVRSSARDTRETRSAVRGNQRRQSKGDRRNETGVGQGRFTPGGRRLPVSDRVSGGQTQQSPRYRRLSACRDTQAGRRAAQDRTHRGTGRPPN